MGFIYRNFLETVGPTKLFARVNWVFALKIEISVNGFGIAGAQ